MKAFKLETDDGSEQPVRAFTEDFAGRLLRRLPVDIRIGDDDQDNTTLIPLSRVFDSSDDFRQSFVTASVNTMTLLALPVEDPEALATLLAVTTTSLVLDLAPGLVNGDDAVAALRAAKAGDAEAAFGATPLIPTVTDWGRIREVLGVSDSPFLNIEDVRKILARKRNADGRPNIPR